jgi:hypothetical protein
MTTNIFDSSGHLMATDSRWSIEYGDWLLYLDDTGYEKMLVRNGKVLMFAGYGRVIQLWKDWINSDPPDPSGMPAHKGMSVCMVDGATRTVDFDAEQDIVANGVYCAGSGSRSAYSCWSANRDAHRAVETAKSKDIFSGGEVKFYNFKNGSNNLVNNYPTAGITIKMVDQAILSRGSVMKTNTNSTSGASLPFPKVANAKAADDAANDDKSAVEEIREKIAAGELSANAPCDGMHNDWTEENKAKFQKALGNMFGWKNNA